jgi:UDP-N-acetylmuramate dehydrogenase
MDMSEIAGTRDIQELLSLQGLRGEMRWHESMRKHTSWRAGGVAACMYIPADLIDLGEFLRQSYSLQAGPVCVVGLGSNLLVRDGGIRGIVILLHARLGELYLQQGAPDGDGVIVAGAGAACAKVARFAAMHNLTGAEFMAGIPGTVGGALAMNAGCYGSETWQIVQQVQTIDRTGQRYERSYADYEISYRHVAPRQPLHPGGEWFISGSFRLKHGNGEVSRNRIKELLAARISSQPLGLPNAGSVFRNPPGDHAARLIEACGLKGRSVGGAMVSPKHANFIVNVSRATASDIEALINVVHQTVRQETGVDLVREVRIIGEAA